MRDATHAIVEALGLTGRPIVRMQITLEAGKVPQVVIEEHIIDGGEIKHVLSEYELVER